MSFVGIGMQLSGNAAGLLGAGNNDLPRRIENIVLANGLPYGIIEADITVEETHNSTLQVTQHPILQGSAISDHVYRMPSTITVIMGWSTSPVIKHSLVSEALGYASTRSALVNTAANALGAVQGVANLLGAQKSKAQQAYAQLRMLQTSSALFDLSTGKYLYKTVVCEDVNFTDNYKTANAIFMRVTFRQMFIVPLAIGSVTTSKTVANGAIPGVLASGVKFAKQLSSDVSGFLGGLGVSL